MKKIMLFIMAVIPLFTFGQNVGINATGAAPDASAGLDVNFTNKGLLIPRVALTAQSDATTITSPTKSMLVYNTGASWGTEGYYYNSGTAGSPVWVRFATTKEAWLLTGNASTVAGTNFLGTTDAVDLVFKTTSAERMRILSGGNVGIGITNPTNKLSIIGGGLSWGNAAEINLLTTDQGGSMELGGTNSIANPTAGAVPYIDFHYGTGSAQDYNTRIINDANGRLDLIGTIRINGAYNLPTADGSKGQVLTTDGSGTAYWGYSVGKICDVSLTNATSYTVSGLDGNTDKTYWIILQGVHKNGVAAQKMAYIRPNNDGTNANYCYGMDVYWLYTGGYGWDYEAFDIAGVWLWITNANYNDNYVTSSTVLSASTGQRRLAVTKYSLEYSSKYMDVSTSSGGWIETSTNITSLTFYWEGTGFTGRLFIYALR